MRRGSTPTHTFALPACIAEKASAISAIEITYEQKNQVILQKREQDCTINGDEVSVTLSQEETFLFKEDVNVQIQLRIKVDGKVIPSDIMRVSCKECLSDEVI